MVEDDVLVKCVRRVKRTHGYTISTCKRCLQIYEPVTLLVIGQWSAFPLGVPVRSRCLQSLRHRSLNRPVQLDPLFGSMVEDKLHRVD